MYMIMYQCSTCLARIFCLLLALKKQANLNPTATNKWILPLTWKSMKADFSPAEPTDENAALEDTVKT